MAEQSLLTDELRSYVGRTSGARTVRVTEEAVRRSMAVYAGDSTRSLTVGSPVPGFVLMSLGPDGANEGIRVPDPLPKSVLVSNEFTVERPLRLGEELVAEARVADISERLGGQFGHGIYVRSDVEFRDADGGLVGRTSSTLMYYDPEGARSREGGG